MDSSNERSPRVIGHRPLGFRQRGRAFARSPAGELALRSRGHANSNTVQPRGDGAAIANAGCGSHERKEHSLKRVFGVGVMRKHLPAHGPDERAVSADQFLKRSMILRAQVASEQLSIRSDRLRFAGNGVQQRWCHHG